MTKFVIPACKVTSLARERTLVQSANAGCFTKEFLEGACPSHITHVGKTPEQFAEAYEKNLSRFPKIVPSKSKIGLEVEVEGIDDWWAGVIHDTGIWRWDTDTSLKDRGVEFISKPLAPNTVPQAMSFLWTCMEFFNRETPIFDWRSSFHIHVNQLPRNSEHVLKLVLLHSIFEDSLFQFADPRRKENIFCVPINKTELSYRLAGFLHGRFDFRHAVEYWQKYSALNLRPLVSIGTVEFRHMGGTNDLRKLGRWINLILRLDAAAEENSLDSLYEDIEKINTESYYQAFKERIFGESVAEWLADTEQARHMSDGVKFVKECFASNDWNNAKENSAYHNFVNEEYAKLQKTTDANIKNKTIVQTPNVGAFTYGGADLAAYLDPLASQRARSIFRAPRETGAEEWPPIINPAAPQVETDDEEEEGQ